MTVVSDTSVLIHLAGIDRFSLLRRLYADLTIPQAVWRETVEEGGGRPGAPETRSAHTSGWIEIADPDADNERTYANSCQQVIPHPDAGSHSGLQSIFGKIPDRVRNDVPVLRKS